MRWKEVPVVSVIARLWNFILAMFPKPDFESQLRRMADWLDKNATFWTAGWEKFGLEFVFGNIRPL